jgi:hypothetical protein
MCLTTSMKNLMSSRTDFIPTSHSGRMTIVCGKSSIAPFPITESAFRGCISGLFGHSPQCAILM